jgi:hypothetical protein
MMHLYNNSLPVFASREMTATALHNSPHVNRSRLTLAWVLIMIDGKISGILDIL